MPYTYQSLAFVWLIIFALAAVSASGWVTGWGLVLVLATACAAPALILRMPTPSSGVSL